VKQIETDVHVNKKPNNSSYLNMKKLFGKKTIIKKETDIHTN
jgi:hypothetical protein